MPAPTPYTSSPVTSYTTPLGTPANISALIAGYKWGTQGIGTSATIYYSFPSSNNPSLWDQGADAYFYGPGYETYSGFRGLNASEQASATTILQSWSNVANINISHVATETNGSVGDIRIAFTNDGYMDANTYAYAYYPNGESSGGDVWLNATPLDATAHDFNPGQNGYLTILHEVGHALGLSHPFEAENALPTSLDSYKHTVMSYSDAPSHFDTGTSSFYPTTPMLLDIQAMQYLYGANMTYHAGDDVYTFDENNTYYQTIWDAGGTDTIQYTGNNNATINLNAGTFSILGAPITLSNGTIQYDNVAIAYNVVIEKAIGGNGSDTIYGNQANNNINGAGGNDIIDGGLGTDQAIYTNKLEGYNLSLTGSIIIVQDTNVYNGDDGIDSLRNIEQVQFNGVTYRLDINKISYIAANGDLINAFGSNTEAAYSHYISYGLKEGRAIDFDALGYVARHTDLIITFGTDVNAATTHYINYGYTEGRAIGFDALSYIASNADLIIAFGTDGGAATTHYINYGYTEGRAIGFDALSYIASNADLITAFGTNGGAATTHYINYGYTEGRAIDFDALSYIASNADLITAFGTDGNTATTHYINYGYAENRELTFDVEWYIQKYTDVFQEFGNNQQAALIDFINNRSQLDYNDDPISIIGTNQVDVLNGSAGKDNISSLAGDDTINGNLGNDTLVGGIGDDILAGGAGADTFKWGLSDKASLGSPSQDTITDFSLSENDILDLKDLLIGESIAFDNLRDYLEITTTVGNTEIHISSEGNFLGGNYNASNEDAHISLTGIDLFAETGAATEADLLQHLVTNSNLIVDS